MIKLINDDVLKADFSEVPPIQLVITSPPYNVGISYDKHVDTMTYNDYLYWSEKWIQKCFLLQPISGRIIINVPFSTTPIHLKKEKNQPPVNYPLASDITQICKKIGYNYYRTVVWEKMGSNKTSWGSWRRASSPSMIDPNEALLIFYKDQWKRNTKGTSTISGKEFMTSIKNIWKMQPETRSKHPAAFPLALPDRCIKLFSYKEDTIMDCFLGSGTTGESAVRLGRNFVGIEKSENYFNMAKERIDKATIQTSIISQITPIIPYDINDEDAW